MTSIEITNDNPLIPEFILRKLLFSGCKFQYESYDHNKAIEEIKKNDLKNGLIFDGYDRFSSYEILSEMKQKYRVYRIGKLRQIDFAPDGSIRKIYIGNKYNKTFYLYNFGKEVKPIIFKSDDEYDLIGQGLAIEDTL
jgi:hypothetical protein